MSEEELVVAAGVTGIYVGALTLRKAWRRLRQGRRMAQDLRSTEEAVDLSPGDAARQLRLGVLQLRQGLDDSAHVHLQSCERLKPSWVLPRILRSHLLAEAGHLKQALEQWNPVPLEPLQAIADEELASIQDIGVDTFEGPQEDRWSWFDVELAWELRSSLCGWSGNYTDAVTLLALRPSEPIETTEPLDHVWAGFLAAFQLNDRALPMTEGATLSALQGDPAAGDALRQAFDLLRQPFSASPPPCMLSALFVDHAFLALAWWLLGRHRWRDVLEMVDAYQVCAAKQQCHESLLERLVFRHTFKPLPAPDVPVLAQVFRYVALLRLRRRDEAEAILRQALHRPAGDVVRTLVGYLHGETPQSEILETLTAGPQTLSQQGQFTQMTALMGFAAERPAQARSLWDKVLRDGHRGHMAYAAVKMQ